jgi:hypothetical protein
VVRQNPKVLLWNQCNRGPSLWPKCLKVKRKAAELKKEQSIAALKSIPPTCYREQHYNKQHINNNITINIKFETRYREVVLAENL